MGKPPPMTTSRYGFPLEVITWAVCGEVRVPRIGFVTAFFRKLVIFFARI